MDIIASAVSTCFYNRTIIFVLQVATDGLLFILSSSIIDNILCYLTSYDSIMSNIFKVFKNLTKTKQPAIKEAQNLAIKKTQAATVKASDTNDKMATQVILNNGIKMPRIGLGTYGVKDKETCLKVFNEALACGYRLFDTGTLYGNDQFIGDVVYDKLSTNELKRDEVFVGTKIAPFQHVHWPGVAKVPPNDPKNKSLRAETWRELEEFVADGKIKSIGVSNYTQNHLEDLLSYCKIKPTVNQVEFHPMCYQKDLLDFCKSNQIYLQAYSSLGSSQSKPPGWQVLFGNEIVKSLASKYNKTIPQILLRWGLQHDCLLIPKTSRVENLGPNLDILNFVIDQDDMVKLNGLNQDKHFCWNPKDIV